MLGFGLFKYVLNALYEIDYFVDMILGQLNEREKENLLVALYLNSFRLIHIN